MFPPSGPGTGAEAKGILALGPGIGKAFISQTLRTLDDVHSYGATHKVCPQKPGFLKPPSPLCPKIFTEKNFFFKECPNFPTRSSYVDFKNSVIHE